MTVKLARKSDVTEGTLTKATCPSGTFLLTQVGDEYVAVDHRCPHLGWSMTRGQVENGAITCPWHGSRFDVCSGENLDWTNAFAGVPMPRWTHRMLALGRKPRPLTVKKLTVVGDDLVLADQ